MRCRSGNNLFAMRASSRSISVTALPAGSLSKFMDPGCRSSVGDRRTDRTTASSALVRRTLAPTPAGFGLRIIAETIPQPYRFSKP